MMIKTKKGWRRLLPIFLTRPKDQPGKGLHHSERRALSPEMQAIASRVEALRT